MKKTFLFLTALCFCAFANKALAWTGTGTAADPWLIGDGQTNTASAVKAKLVDSTLTIFGTGNMADFYYSTEGEAPWWFNTAQRNAIQFVTIENGVTNIGDRAFKDCSNLASITIPNSVSIIGQQSFYNCTSLYALVIPSSTTTIEDEAFYNCTGLLSIADMRTAPQNINSNVFQGVAVNNIYLATPKEATATYQSMSIWSGFKFVAPYVLYNENLGNTLNAAVIGLDGTALYFEYQGSNSNIPKQLTVYDGASDNIKMVVAYNTDGVPNGLFIDNTLFSIEKNNDNTYNITSTDSNGNHRNKNGISINIPWTADDARSIATNGVSTILDKILENSNELLENTTPSWIGLSDLILSTLGVDKLMPPSVKAIYTGYMAAFSVVSAFTSCGNMIFWAATGAGLPLAFLSSAACAASIYSLIHSYTDFEKAIKALYGNNDDTGNSGSTTLDGGILTISNDDAFSTSPYFWADRKNEITTVVIGSGVTSIPSGAFYGCTALKTFIIQDGKNDLTFVSGISGYPAIPIQTLYIGRNTYHTGGNYGGYGAATPFANLTTLTSVTIGNNVTSLYDGYFQGCTGLTSISIPSSISSIAPSLFYNCSNLANIDIPNTVTNIGNLAFYNTAFTSFTIKNTIDTIGSSVFNGCKSLKTFIIQDGKNDLTFVSGISGYPAIPIQTLYIGRNTSQADGNYGGYGTTPFANLTTLTSVTIGNNVTSLYDGYFQGCTGLTSLTSYATIPPIIKSSYTFNNVNKSIPVYIPCGNNIYQTTDYWKDFTNYQCGVQITTESNSAVVSFPKIDNATNYSLNVYSDEGQTILVKELHLDANGNLRAAQQTLSCTVSGLNANAQYYYSLAPYDTNGNMLSIFSGNFTTTNNTAINVIESQELKIYPNPTKNEIFINSELPIKKVEISDLTGHNVKIFSTTSVQNGVQTISLSSLLKGIYLVKVYTDNGITVSKIVKE